MMRNRFLFLLGVLMLGIGGNNAQSGLAAVDQIAAAIRASNLRGDGVQAQAINPFVQLAKLIPSDGVNGAFGAAVAISGDTVVAGAPFHNTVKGSAYVFVKSGDSWNGTLTETARLAASDIITSGYLGISVALSGNTIVVGAPLTPTGAAYVFVRPGGGWSGTVTPTAKLIASDGAGNDQFGRSVAINGDTIVVGAVGDDIGLNADQGSAYVFVKPGGGWNGTLTQTAKLVATDGAVGDELGVAVTVSNDAVGVGAATDDIGLNANQGSAYVFVKPGGGWSGTLTQTAKLTASDGAVDDGFGFAVALNGDTLAVGAPTNLATSPATQGAAYIFIKPGTGWASTSIFNAKLTPSDGVVDNGFGFSVALNSETALVGAIGDQSRRGAAYLFSKPISGWSGTLSQTRKLTAGDGVADDGLGASVALSNDTMISGAPGDDGQKGAVFVFAPGSSLYLPVILRNSP